MISLLTQFFYAQTPRPQGIKTLPSLLSNNSLNHTPRCIFTRLYFYERSERLNSDDAKKMQRWPISGLA